MKSKAYLAALDIGTRSCKVVIYDPNNRQLYSASEEYGLLFPQLNYVEQDPEIWYRTAITILRGLIRKVPDANFKISALCISGTNGLVMIDELGHTVSNAVMFSDRRSETQADELRNRYGTMLDEITGNHPMPGSFSLPIINWFREMKPDLWERVRTILVPAGYMIMRLTGKRTIDTTRASMTLLFDLAKRRWSNVICERENIADEILPELFEPWEIVGRISPEVSKLIGIKNEVVVLAGCVDSVAAAVGAGIVESEHVMVMVGTTGRITMSVGTPSFDSNLINVCHAVPEHWVCTAAMNNSGGSLQWFADSFGHIERAMESRVGISRYKLIDMAASLSPAGAKGIIFLPYLGGERSPVWNSKAQGVFFGLSGDARWPDLARSVMEGVAFSFKDSLASMEQAMAKRGTRFVLVGGGAKSKLWQQILCNVLERPLEIPEITEVETSGCLALAGYATQIWGSIHEAIDTFSGDPEELTPDPRYLKIYTRRFQLYKELYTALVPLFEKAVEII